MCIRDSSELSTLNPEVERALFVALDDPYFEVRSQAARALATLGSKLRGAAAEEAAVRVTRLIRDRNFEVARDGVRALGQLALDAETALPALKALHYHRNWQVRDALIGAYRRLYERGILRDRDQMLAILDDVLITTEGFRPLFPLKQNVQRFRNHLENGGSPAVDSAQRAEEGEASA